MAGMQLDKRLSWSGMVLLLLALYLFLYSPIAYIIYISFASDTMWPFPWKPTIEAYENLSGNRIYQQALWNSFLLSFGAATLSALFATMGGIALLKYRSRWRGLFGIILISPLFVAELLIGISTLLFNKQVLGLPGNMVSAILANAVHGVAFGFLIILTQLVRYNWRMDDAAMVFGATPSRVFREITLPISWPAILGAFLISFLLAFNNLEISFYNLGAIPTLPSVAWGSLRFGVKSELLALTALVNGFVFIVFAILYVFMRTGLVRFGYRGE